MIKKLSKDLKQILSFELSIDGLVIEISPNVIDFTLLREGRKHISYGNLLLFFNFEFEELDH